MSKKRQPPPESVEVVITQEGEGWKRWKTNTGLTIEESEYNAFGEEGWNITNIDVIVYYSVEQELNDQLSLAEFQAIIQYFLIGPWQKRLEELRQEQLVRLMAGVE